MAIEYRSLNERTRRFMVSEIENDISKGSLYISPRLTKEHRETWVYLLIEAAKGQSDSWLAEELRSRHMLAAQEQRKTKSGYTTVKVPSNAHEALAEGEFNRFYIRAVCLATLEDKKVSVTAYRGRASANPRPETEAAVGKEFDAAILLEDLRSSPGVDTALGIPSGPNSGLTVFIPE